MHLALQVAGVFLKKRGKKSPSFTAWMSLLGVSFGVAAFVVVVSIFSSFTHELKSLIFAANPNMAVYSSDGIADVGAAIQELTSKLEPRFPVRAIHPFQYNEGIVSKGSLSAVVYARGITPEALKEPPLWRLVEGNPSFDVQDTQGVSGVKSPIPVALGTGLMARLDARVGDVVHLMAPRPGQGGQVDLQLKIAGKLHVGLAQYDDKLVLMPFLEARQAFGSEKGASGLDVSFVDPDVAMDAARAIGNDVPWILRPWQSIDSALFEQVERDGVAIRTIVSLISAVATFNILVTLWLGVVDHSKQIAILRSLGASRPFVIRIFLWMGFLLGCGGAVLGTALAALLLFVLKGIPLGDLQNFYFLDHVPVSWDPFLFLLASGMALVVALLASILPAFKATGVSPLTGLKSL